MSRPISITSAVTFIPASSGVAGSYGFTTSTNANSAVTNAYTNADSTTSARLTVPTTASRTYGAYFNYDMSALSDIPSDATINSVSGRVKYYFSNTSTNRLSAVTIQLYTNTTAKGTAVTARTGTAASIQNINGGSWTRSELQNARLYVSVRRGTNTSNLYMYLYGTDMTVNYTVNGTEYEVSFNNQSSDATTDPSTTQYVYQGESQEIKIYIDNTNDYAVKDNGTNVNNSLVLVTAYTPSSEITTAPGASYGFELDTSDGYYKSQNKGVSYSAAVCRLKITADTQCTLTLTYVNYAEATYDYGIIGKVDSSLLTTSAISDTSAWLWAGSANTNNSTTVRTTAVTIPSGEHFIDIKFRKDNATNSNNDDFRFKYSLSETALSNPYYRYTISNIAADHTISIEDVGGTFYNVNASSTYAGATVTPATQSIREGRSANIQIAVNNLYEIVVKDNGTTVTNSLVQNSTGYTYTVTNVQAIHNITIEEATYYTVTTASTYAGATATVNPSKVYAGMDSFVEVNVNHLYEIVVKDNGTVISLTEPIDTTGNFIPTEYDDEFSTNGGVYSQTYGYDNGLGDSESTSYCRAYLNTGAQAESRLSYKFDCSSIPENARITSVSCVVRAYCNGSTQYVPTREVQLYNGTTAKGTAGTLGTANGTVNVNGGTWTREELDDIRIVARCVRGNSNATTNYYYYFYGASLAIEYEVPASYHLSNVQTNHTITIEEAPYYTVTINNAYQGATFTVDPQKGYSGIDVDVRIDIDDIDEIKVIDNGVNVNANIINVGAGVYRYTINAIAANHTINVTESTKYGITATSTYNAVTIEPATAQVVEGKSKTFLITPDAETIIETDIVLTDNGVDVTNQIIAGGDGETGSSEYYLTTFDAASSDYVGIYNNYEYTNAEGNSAAQGMANTGGTRSSFYPATGAGQTVTVVYNIPGGAIPNGAILDGVTCSGICSVAYAGSGYTDVSLQLYAGSTPKGEATIFTPVTVSSAVTVNVDGGSSWTTAELMNAKVVLHGIRNDYNSNNDATGIRDNVNMHGATMVVHYHYPSGYNYTVSNVQSAHTLVITEVPAAYYTINASSTYAEATVTPATQSIRNGRTASVEITVASIDDIVVKDNGTDVTTGLVPSMDGFTYTIRNVQSAHTIVVEEAPSYAITTSSQYADATISPASQSVRARQTATTYIEVGNPLEISVKDNGVEVADQLVFVSGGTEYTASAILSTFDQTNSQYVGIYSTYDYTHAENHSSAEGLADTGSTRSAFYPATGAGSELYIYYNFAAITGVPSNAVITNVSAAVVMGTAYSGQGYSDVEVQLCIGTTAVGTATHPTIGQNTGQAAGQLVNVDGGSEWTLADLSNAKVLIHGVRNGTNSNNDDTGTRDNLYMHGADITVTYTDGESFNGYTYTISNVQEAHTVVITENPQYTLTSASHVQGVTIAPASVTVRGRESVTFDISGDLADSVVLDNNIDVTTQLRVNSTGRTYTITNVQAAHSVIVSGPSAETDFIKIAGQYKKVVGYYKKTNGIWTLIQKSDFDTQVSSEIVFYGGVIEVQTIGEATSSGGAINISINDGALESGAYRMVYEDANKTPLTGYTDINSFTIQ